MREGLLIFFRFQVSLPGHFKESGTGDASPSLFPSASPEEAFEKRSILFKFKGYSAEERNWTAARLPDRARRIDAPSQREDLALTLHCVQPEEYN
jgi:hypothetical protein